MNRFVILTGFVVFVSASAVEAQTREWKTLATVQLVAGRNGESVTARSDWQPFRDIRVCADQRPVRITGLHVNFVRGARQRIGMQRLLQPGACMPTTRLRQNGAIRSIYVGHDRVRSTPPPTTVRVQVR